MVVAELNLGQYRREVERLLPDRSVEGLHRVDGRLLSPDDFGLVAIAVVTTSLSDKSIRGFGMMMYGAPWGVTAFAVALIGMSRQLSRRRTWLAFPPPRRRRSWGHAGWPCRCSTAST